MQVWELMAILSKKRADCRVYLSRGLETHTVDLESVDEDVEDEPVFLRGDGSEPLDDDVPL